MSSSGAELSRVPEGAEPDRLGVALVVVRRGSLRSLLELLRDGVVAAPQLAFVVMAPNWSLRRRKAVLRLLRQSTGLAVSSLDSGHSLRKGEVGLLGVTQSIACTSNGYGPEVVEKAASPSFLWRRVVDLACALCDRLSVVALRGRGDGIDSSVDVIRAYGARVLIEGPADGHHGAVASIARSLGSPDCAPLPTRGEGPLAKALGVLVRSGVAVSAEIDLDYAEAVLEARRRARRLESIVDYSEFAAHNDAEASLLSQRLTVGIVDFGFDQPTLRSIAAKHLPNLLANDADSIDSKEFRVWVPNVGAGAEVYAVSMLLQQVPMGGRALRVFGTDSNRANIQLAGRGALAAGQLSGVPTDLRERYFRSVGDRWLVRSELRENILFVEHDLGRDTPFCHLDMVFCRRQLGRCRTAAMQSLPAKLAFALRRGGLLVVAPGDDVDGLELFFEPLDESRCIWVRNAATATNGRGTTSSEIASAARVGTQLADVRAQRDRLASALCCFAEAFHATALVVAGDLTVVEVIRDENKILRVPQDASTRDLLKMVAPELRGAVASLCSDIEHDSRNGVLHSFVDKNESSDEVVHRYRIEMLQFDAADIGPRWLLWLVPADTVHNDESSDAVTLRRELAHNRARLHRTIGELSRANERLRESNTALATSNEQLQAANEELHSVNEELYTVNAEHQSRIQEQHVLASDLDHLLQATDVASVFLDVDLRIRRFTRSCSTYLPVIARDIGRPVGDLRHALDIDLKRFGALVLERSETIAREVPLRGKDTRWISLRGLPYRGDSEQITGVVLTLVDVTHVHQVEDELVESETRFRQLADHIRDVFWVRSVEDDRLEYVSPAVHSLWGIDREKMLAQPGFWFEAIHEDDRDRVRHAYEGLANGRPLDVDYRLCPDNTHQSGGPRWIHDSGSAVLEPVTGRTLRAIGLARDITRQKLDEADLREAATALEHLAHVDSLTGLINRRGLERELAIELERTRRDGDAFSAILADCDDFKKVNDQLGHAAGDVVLKQLAQRLRDTLRPSDRIGRLGGDEFLVLLPQTRVAEAVAIAERLRLAVTDSIMSFGNEAIRVSASFGVVPVDPEVLSLEEIIGRAHSALAASKAGGKNRVARSPTKVDSGVQARPEVTRLITSSSLRVYAQPIVALRGGQVIGQEFLCRGPRGVLEAPTTFFGLAKEDDALTVVDLACLRASIRALERTPEGLGRVHINVFPSTILETVEASLDQLFSRHARRLCLEISEQLFLGDPSYLRDRVRWLATMGMLIAIDDVGFGRSSLESLIILEPDVVKIDRRFVHGCSSDSGKRRNLERLLRVAGGLGATVVAEGVETKGDADVLEGLGVPFAQGFYWQKPHAI